MAMLPNAVLDALHTGFSGIFRGAYEGTSPWADMLATTVPSTTTSNTYGWMRRVPQLRQWIGAKVVQDIASHSYQLTNLPYELTIGVDRHDWEDENLGVYQPLFAEMGRAAAKWPDQILTTLIQANGNGFDAVAMFAATHPLDPAGNQDNDFNLALTAANYATVREAMMAFTGEDGQPLAVMPDLLIVPPQLELQARQVLFADIIPDTGGVAAGITNVLKNSAKLLVIPEFANQPTRWYLIDSSKPIKPFIWQLREAPQLIAKTQRTDDGVFWDRELVWGIESRGAAGYGPWWLAARSTP